MTAEELELGRAPLTRGYPRGFETAEQVGRAAAQLALYDLPDDYFTTFVPKVLSLTPEDLTRAAATHIDPSRFLTVIVGDRDKMGAVDDLGLGEAIVVEGDGVSWLSASLPMLVACHKISRRPGDQEKISSQWLLIS